MEDHHLLQEDQEDQEDQKDQGFHVQSIKTLSYSPTRIPSTKVKHEYQNFQISIGDNHGRSLRY
jgi:hypothetical protein